jgi:predicted NBD/HSP70 family sugar kinase
VLDASPRRSADRVDQLAVRRSNLGLVLRTLRESGPRSRAGLAADTGLNKATVSSLVAELVARGLVAERGLQRGGAVGRPGVAVELAAGRVYGVGVEINVDYVAIIALDLDGTVVAERRLALDVPRFGPGAVLDRIGKVLDETIGRLSGEGATPAGVTVAIPGLIAAASGRLSFAPNLGWRDVPVVDELVRRLGDPDYPVRLDNDANLAVLGEWAFGPAAGTPDLVYLTGEVGVGGGVISAGRLLRGWAGYSGEVGHLPLQPDGELCGCGRRGCWETTVGLAALLRGVADEADPVRDPSLDLEQRLAEIVRRAAGKDPRTLAALDRIGSSLGVGASILANLFNPQVIVLGGYFAAVGPYLLERMMAELRARVVAADVGGCRVEFSRLGFTAAVRGGAHLALQAVVDDPTRAPIRGRARPQAGGSA